MFTCRLQYYFLWTRDPDSRFEHWFLTNTLCGFKFCWSQNFFFFCQSLASLNKSSWWEYHLFEQKLILSREYNSQCVWVVSYLSASVRKCVLRYDTELLIDFRGCLFQPSISIKIILTTARVLCSAIDWLYSSIRERLLPPLQNMNNADLSMKKLSLWCKNIV